MTRIEVVAPGLLTTVQDLGRPGFAEEGVPRGGAADVVSLRAANRLAGNADGAAALEMTLVGAAFLFRDPTVAAVAGADLEGTWERGSRGRSALPPWSRVEVAPGDIVRFRAARNGARAYLAVRGGIAVPPVLGSASTHLPSGLGGIGGRALRKGDLLETLGAGATSAASAGEGVEDLRDLVLRGTLRIVPGPQTDWFGPDAMKELDGGRFVVDESSDRTGVRLNGPWPPLRRTGSLWTEGVLPGHVQVTPDGRGIVLGVDGPTTGGYPKIASVIEADLPALGQLRPRDTLRFELVDLPFARREIVRLHRRLEEVFRG